MPNLSLSLVGGVRWQRLHTGFRLNDIGLMENNLGWVDPIIVVVYRTSWGRAWDLVARGDIGGFILGSRFVYRLEGRLGYAFTPWLLGTAGYRHLDVAYGKGGTAWT